MKISGGKRYLIVNADEFGRSPAVNRGIVRAHKHGIVTSASLMVRWPSAIDAALYGDEHPELSLGLHIDLEELSWEQGAWVQRYQMACEDDTRDVEREALLQLEFFRRLTGKNPTHIDSHQHVHKNENVRAVLTEIADWLGIPLRGCGWQLRYCGDFYGQDAKGRPSPGSITVDGFCGIAERLEAGITELSCHPGEVADWDSMYKFEREQEVTTLCDPRVKAKVMDLGIELCSFHELESLLRCEGLLRAHLRFSGSRRTA